MEKDLGFEELSILSSRLQARAESFAVDADESQSEGMKPYLVSQENSLEQARFALEQYRNEFLKTAKACIQNADNKSTVRLLHAYGEFGLKEN